MQSNNIISESIITGEKMKPNEHSQQSISLTAWIMIGICLLTSYGSFLPTPEYSIWVQAIQKPIWALLVIVGIFIYKPKYWNFWLCLALFFVTTGIRNIIRLSIYLRDGKWIYFHDSSMEMMTNTVGALFLITGSIILMRGRRPKGEWWALADAWVIGIAIFITGFRSIALPIYIEQGITWGLYHHLLIITRATLTIVPILAILLSERVRGVSFYMYSMGIFLMFSGDYFIGSLLGGNDTYNWIRTVTIIAQSLGQTLLVISALIPSMNYIILPLHNPRPPWNWIRTIGMSLSVLTPIIVMKFSAQLEHKYRDVIYLSFCVLLLSLVLRNRLAVLTAARTQLAIEHLAYHDELTSLPNRHYLNTILIQEMKVNIDQNNKLIMICCYIDLDGLKYINDRFGHQAGDQMIVAVARILKTLPAHWNHTSIRVGGDEFVVLIPVISALNTEQVYEIGEHIHSIILKALEGEKNREVHSSVGVAQMVFTAKGRSTPLEYIDKELNHLLGYADLAQVDAKRSGGSRVRVYREEMGAQVNRLAQINQELPNAWINQQMFMAYQPVISLSTGVVRGAEGLLRWRHPELGMIPPDEGIRAAEQLGTILDLGQQILLQALRDIDETKTSKMIRVGCNLSGHQLQPESLNRLIQIVSDSGLGDRLCLEITEQELVDSHPSLNNALEELRNMGVLIAIDDFGTGFCGLEYLCKLPIDIIKFDGIFAREAKASLTHRRVLQYGVQLANSLGALTVAEGIEDLETAHLMRDLGCTYGQGYWIKRPTEGLTEALKTQPHYSELLVR